MIVSEADLLKDLSACVDLGTLDLRVSAALPAGAQRDLLKIVVLVVKAALEQHALAAQPPDLQVREALQNFAGIPPQEHLAQRDLACILLIANLQAFQWTHRDSELLISTQSLFGILACVHALIEYPSVGPVLFAYLVRAAADTPNPKLASLVRMVASLLSLHWSVGAAKSIQAEIASIHAKFGSNRAPQMLPMLFGLHHIRFDPTLIQSGIRDAEGLLASLRRTLSLFHPPDA